ncbi:hypothetical protein [Saccharopolyspora pogona]|uniref:hypothetical protein n=1 Tax=Saccharopolyspora pogona TaxID=333966 RepID=UPI00168685C8|nr:hypothetical protein [Saccharopolyspora pogona]
MSEIDAIPLPLRLKSPRTRNAWGADVHEFQNHPGRGKHGPHSPTPPAVRPHRGYWFFGAPPDDAGTVLYIGHDHPLADHFGQSRELSEIETGLVNMVQGNTITLYQNPKQPWHALWPRIRTI